MAFGGAGTRTERADEVPHDTHEATISICGPPEWTGRGEIERIPVEAI
jgi:hypothetical protein